MADSHELIAEYVRTGSEIAFRELVTRYVNLVHSTALRVVGGDTHLAEDVTQTVFVHLSRKAHSLTNGVMLGGWLHRATLHVATTIVRGESRRKARERQSVEMNTLRDHSDANLAQLAPILDEAIDKLDAEDRCAILLRFFEQLDFRSVGEMLDTNEDAARKRVTRALEKLQSFLKHRGVALSATALGTALATEAVATAPVGLAASIAGTALANAGGGGVASLLKLTTMTKLQAAMLGTVVVAGVATSLMFSHQAQVKLREENKSLRLQMTRLQSENEAFSNRFVQTAKSSSLDSNRLRELLKLRGEVTLLRRRQQALESAAVQPKPPGTPRQPDSGEVPQAGKPAPFQVQIVVDQPGEDSEPITNNASGASPETLYVQKTPALDYTAISSAAVTTDTSTGAPQIDVQFSEVGRELFAAITKENMNKRLAIVLNGQLCSAPVIRSEISGGKALVTGSFTQEEARELVSKINEAIADK